MTDLKSKTKQTSPDNNELVATYHNENILYKDFYDLIHLTANTSYTIRLRAKNDQDVTSDWSEWSQNLTVRTSADERDKITQHRSSHMHHHYNRLYHDKSTNSISWRRRPAHLAISMANVTNTMPTTIYSKIINPTTLDFFSLTCLY